MRGRTWGLLTTMLFVTVPRIADAGCVLEQYAQLPVTMMGTRPLIAGSINGMDALFLADSGAFFSMLSRESIDKYQLKLQSAPDRLQSVRGVGGEEAVRLTNVKEFALSGLRAHSYRDVQFLVGGNAFAGGEAGIIGQNIIGYADTEYDLANGVIRLMHPKDCGDSPLAYWHGTVAVGEVDIERTTPLTPHLIGTAKLNGSKIRVMFDTGAARSVLTLKAATRAGFTLNAVDVQIAGLTSGIGPRQIETWIARFDSLDFNDEQIRNARLRVGDLDLLGADMLLGADFFLSHRIYVAAKQHRIYFTFNGGRVFDLSTNKTADASEHGDAGDTPGVEEDPGAPNDAAGLRRRGAAFAGRRDFEHAMRDFDRAIKLDPTDAENYFQRAVARLQSGQPALGTEDLDQTLKLKPDHVGALLRRGALRLHNRDDDGARTDFESIAKLVPNDAGIALAIAGIYEQTDHSDEAINRLDRWIAAWPHDDRRPTALNDRCWQRALTGKDLDLALADCNAALRNGATNSAFLDSRALVFLKRGELDKAIADYRAALKLQPKSAWSMFGLGVAEEKKGLKAEGEKDMQAATVLFPGVADRFRKIGVTP